MNPDTGRTIFVGIGLFGTVLVGLSIYGVHYFTQRIEASSPFRQQILSAMAKIDVVIDSDAKIDTHFMDGNTYFALGSNNDTMMVLESSDSYGKQNGNGQVVYTANVVMSPPKSLSGVIVLSLENVDLAQIFIRMLPEGSEVVGGTVTCTINSSVKLVFMIHPQISNQHLVFIRDFDEVFSGFIK
ncbi:hypothetical protein E3V36_01735 [Candidatus Marinimicrobia bacterium MT.SAG.2]|nr:hypothetical protein E3V36_01735 [Candidatus Marinimicrobia bacterium MT.SAG.2]